MTAPAPATKLATTTASQRSILTPYGHALGVLDLRSSV